MKTSVLINVAAASAAVAASHLELPFTARASGVSAPSRRRAVQADFHNASISYGLDLEIGTPPQKVQLAISFSSRDTWIPDQVSCDDGYLIGCFGPNSAFASNDSSTFVKRSTYSSGYFDSSSAYGHTFTEIISLGDTQINPMTMNLATEGDLTVGVLGLGPGSADTPYSFLSQLENNDVINSIGYSFSLDGPEATTGSILFGAVDTSKFEAPLTRMTSWGTSYGSGLTVEFSALSVVHPGKEEADTIAAQNDLEPALVAPIDLISYMPWSQAKRVWELAGATADSFSNLATVPCAGPKNPDSVLVFGLGTYTSVHANVTLKELVIPRDFYTDNLLDFSDPDDEARCLFGIQSYATDSSLSSMPDSSWTLGSLVLRRLYVAVDLINNEVALAPMRYGATDSRIVAFESYASTIPESELEDYSSRCGATGCDGDRRLDMPGYGRSGSPLGAIIGIAIAAAVALGIIITSIWFCWFRGFCCFKGRKARNGQTIGADKMAPMPIVYYGGPPVNPQAQNLAAVPPAAAGAEGESAPPLPVRPMQQLPMIPPMVAISNPGSSSVAGPSSPAQQPESPAGPSRRPPPPPPIQGTPSDDERPVSRAVSTLSSSATPAPVSPIPTHTVTPPP